MKPGDIYRHTTGEEFRILAVKPLVLDGPLYVEFEPVAGGIPWHLPLAEFGDGRFSPAPTAPAADAPPAQAS